jgi:hypothetical protein
MLDLRQAHAVMGLVFRVVAESPQVLLVSWTPTPLSETHERTGRQLT